MKTFSSILLFVAILSAHADSPDMLAKDFLHLTNEVFRVEDADARQDFLEAFRKQRGLTPEALSEELLALAGQMSGQPSVSNFPVRRFVVESIGEIGSTNAVPGLLQIAREQSGAVSFSALRAGLRISNCSKEFLDSICPLLQPGTPSAYTFSREVLSEMDFQFQYANPSQSQKVRMLEFLKERTKSEISHADWLDRILCREDPTYGQGDERRQFANRMVSSLPEGHPIRLRFESIAQRLLQKPAEDPQTMKMP